MKSLDQIFVEHDTDKGSVHQYHPHNYGPHYQSVFDNRHLNELSVLEIGVGGGQSIRAWLEYFPAANIVGVDKVSDTNPWNTPGSGVHPRYLFFQGDQSDSTMWKCLRASIGCDFDIIIDDGSHMSGDIINSFNSLWPMLKPGGLYCIEDLQVDQETSIFFTAGFPHHLDWLRDRFYEMNQRTSDIEHMFLCSELAILQKKL